MKQKGLMRQGSLFVLTCLFAIAAAAFLPRLWSQTQDQSCAQYYQTFAENFDAVRFKDAANTSAANWGYGDIRISRLGANFAVSTQGFTAGSPILCAAAGDFTGDGYPDLIGLTSGEPSRLVLARNQALGTGSTDPLFAIDPADSFENFGVAAAAAAVTAGDFNGDGKLDLFLMRDSDFLAALYINTGSTAEPHFSNHNQGPNLDFTGAFKAAGISINGTGNRLHSVDIDKDGDIDILVVSGDKVFLVRNPGPAKFFLEDFEVEELNYDQAPGFTGAAGGTAVTAADFDNDGDIDVLCGTADGVPFLVYYENDGVGGFARKELAIPDPPGPGVVGLAAADLTNDGWSDVFAAAADGAIWYMRNYGLKDTVVTTPEGPVTVTDIDWAFTCINGCAFTALPSGCATLDFDRDGDSDLLIVDAGDPARFHLADNIAAVDVYALAGRAQSVNIAQDVVDPARHAITSIRVSHLSQSVLGGSTDGLGVALYFSNNGGRDWEFYRRFEGADITAISDSLPQNFNTFGADLRFRIILTAEADDVTGHTGASLETPMVDLIQVEYTYVDRREYSRASAAATVVTTGGLDQKLVIGSSFVFPGWEGQLRAYDVTSAASSSGPTSSLTTLVSSDQTLSEGTVLFWDAGQLLSVRSPDDRTVYTARRGADGRTNVRMDFTPANAPALAPYLLDVNNDNAGLIDFVRGRGRAWKLADINHSTPAVVGPPAEDPAAMGAGYGDFKTTWAERTKVLYVGANDGMLHCFDVATGRELWGFIPYNLLPKLTKMWAVDGGDGGRHYVRNIYVDGSPSVADVLIGGQWRTVLVCGQGPGSGGTMAGGLNYYWALDVTDPVNPQPVWEITHTAKSGNQTLLTMGETWSVPAIGRINDGGTPRWVAFMGSGYDNDPAGDVAGTYFYIVGVDSGEVLRTWTVTQVNSESFTGARGTYRYTNIRAAIPGSPTAVDTDRDGFVNFVYFGDLDGRIYRLDVQATKRSNWSLGAIYTDYLYYPIITKPAVWVDAYSLAQTPRIYFGTGGHERGLGTYNPNTDELALREFSFVALTDAGGNNVSVDWYLGNPALLDLSPDLRVGELGVGYKVWADPVVADNIVYFTTLQGSIEAVNPCENLGEAGRLYARYVRQTSTIPAGGTAFKTTDAVPPDYLELVSKARRAVTVGEASQVAGRTGKREIYIQQYDSTIQVLEQPIGSLLRIRSWREVYKIYR